MQHFAPRRATQFVRLDMAVPPGDDSDLWSAFDNDFLDDPYFAYDEELSIRYNPSALEPPPLPSRAASTSAGATPFYSGYTASVRNALHAKGSTIEKSVENVLDAIRHEGLNLEIFLGALFWGDPGCTSNYKISYERSVFMRSTTLLTVLQHWWHPPTSKRSGGGKPMEDFVLSRAGDLLEQDMNAVVTRFRPATDMLTKEMLTSVNFRAVGSELQSTQAPHLWSMLHRLACSRRQEKENTMKNPFHVCPIHMLQYN